MAAEALLTEDQFLNLPDTAAKRELVDGELIESAPAKRSHSEMSKRFVRRLESVLDPARVWIETAYQLGRNRWLTPDVSVSRPGQAVQDDWFQSAPRVAIEIASRGNTAGEIDRKVGLYLEHGAAEVWVIYPKTRGMVVFQKDHTFRIAGDAEYNCERLDLTITPSDRTPISWR